jgi:hypothetical protein
VTRARALPQNPSLEQLKRQAKDLLQAAQQGDPRALRRFGRCFEVAHPPPDAFRLTQAQLVLAREQGFSSWPQFVVWVSERRLPAEPEKLVTLLGARTGWVRAAVERALVETGKPGVAAAVAGLSDPDPRVRAGAAGFMDHFADQSCVPKLLDLVYHDPVRQVRAQALHALGCQRCKPEPLDVDDFPILVHVATHDESWKARRSAICSISQRIPDPRVKPFLEQVLEREAEPHVLQAARHGLRRKQPGQFHLRENKLRAQLLQRRQERLAAEAAAASPPAVAV